MDLGNISPEMIEGLIKDFIRKNHYVRLEFTLKTDLAIEVIKFVEKIVSEELVKQK